MYIDNVFNALGQMAERLPSFSGLLKPSDFNAKSAGVASIMSEAKGYGKINILGCGMAQQHPSHTDAADWPVTH